MIAVSDGDARQRLPFDTSWSVHQCWRAGCQNRSSAVSATPQQELDACTSGVSEMVRLAGAALEHATAGLLQQDPPLQESMAACGRALHALDHALEDHAATVLAARGRLGTGQLPMVIAAVHVTPRGETPGALARQLGDIGIDRGSRPACPTEGTAHLR